ncbi:TetR/AcrR family transcriptional regulator [Virgibacillus oceani]|uniref:TetR family transcriptional regulator n=1 Tax=Virgibacillus oceani TaxID=1479511 RepID=A0A917H3K8_9BACI|nr:TetR/AcrR family transcriptional regulator [Virgibacillus oceani]GGG66848.1 TetR family transcriptional regulator [Virgibacillus oceani]
MSTRGRKKGANGERSRELLLDIAADEFAQKGYYKTKISTIVQRAGVTQPTFYLYFKNKESIFQELVDMFHESLFDLVRNSRLESQVNLNNVSDMIKAKLVAIFQFFANHANLTRIGLFVASDAEDMKEELSKQIAQNLIYEQKEGYFRNEIDMDIVAESLTGIIERLTATKLLNGLKEPKELANEVVHLLLYGMFMGNKASSVYE